MSEQETEDKDHLELTETASEDSDNQQTTKIDYDRLNKSSVPVALIVIAYSLLCSVLLIAFSIISDFSKYIFSLAALYAGYRFFVKNDSVKLRVIFIVLALVFYFVGFMIFVTLAIINDWNIPVIRDQILEIE